MNTGHLYLLLTVALVAFLVQVGLIAFAYAKTRRVLKAAERVQGLRESGRVDEAIETLERLARQAPEEASVHYDLGAALWVEGRPEEAAAAWKKALEADPEMADAHYALGHYHAWKGERTEAEKCYRAALSRSPDCHPAAVGLSVLLLESGWAAEVEKMLDPVVAARPDYAAARLNRGIARALRGNLDGAEEDLRAAVAADESDPAIAAALGNLLAVRRDFGEAIEYLRKGGDVLGLGKALYAAGRRAEARSVLAGALEGGAPLEGAAAEEARRILELIPAGGAR